MTEAEQAYRKGYRAGLDASRGVCTPVTKGNTTTCSVCGSDGIVKSWAELRRFWYVGLTDEGVRKRDEREATLGRKVVGA